MESIQSVEKPTACFVYGSLRPDDDSGMLWTTRACSFMYPRRAIVKDVQLFRATYASAILGRPGHQVVGCVLTAEMSDDTVVMDSNWGKIKSLTTDSGKNQDLLDKVRKMSG